MTGQVPDVDGAAADDPEAVRAGAAPRPASFGRRALLVGGVGVGVLALGAAGVASGVVPVPARVRRAFRDTGVDGTIPSVPAGTIRLEQVASAARGQEVGFFTAVPEGSGDGAGLPVCLILHGATATTADYEAFGFGQFLTAAVQAGVPPFVLAGADGGRTFWAGDGGSDDPQRMLHEEIPAWCDERGFDTSRMAAYGWSMGGHGTLLAAERNPGWLLALAALSPAVSPGDEVFDGAERLDGGRTGIWCGTADPLQPSVQKLVAAIPGGPAIASFSPGAHTRGFWNRITPDAFAFVGNALA